MKWHEAVRHAQEVLALRRIEVPRLEAELLVLEALKRTLPVEYPPNAGPQRAGLDRDLRQALRERSPTLFPFLKGVEQDRAWLYAHLQDEFPQLASQALGQLLERRLAGEPLAYIRGHKEFFGLDFLVDCRVLIPRPETETLVEAALAWLGAWTGPCLAADIGTGCGAIAISLAVHLPQATIYATDASPEALEVAQANAQRHRVLPQVRFRRGDLLEPLPHPFPLIAANLPYLSAGDWPTLPPEVMAYEPQQALYGGERGLDVIERMLKQARYRLVSGGCLLLELGAGQGQRALGLARAAFPKARIRLIPDLAGIPRVLSIQIEAIP